MCVRERPAVFSEQSAHGVNLQITLGHQAFQLAILRFEFLESAHILTLQTAIFALPCVEGILV